MLTMPAYESFDEDLDYFGWTDNISIFTRQSLEPTFTMKVSGGASTKKRQRDNLLAKDTFRMLSQYNDISSTPVTVRFNSLRSGPFGATDPFIKALFASWDFNHEDAESEYMITKELESHLLHLGNSCHDNSLDDYLPEDYSSSRVSNVDIPGELNRSILADTSHTRPTSANGRSLEDVCLKPGFLAEVRKLWAKELQDEVYLDNTLRIGIISEQSPEDIFEAETPIYEFPGKYGNLRRYPKPQKHFVLPPAYTSNSLDYMHI
jgi:hypothetical protein